MATLNCLVQSRRRAVLQNGRRRRRRGKNGGGGGGGAQVCLNGVMTTNVRYFCGS